MCGKYVAIQGNYCSSQCLTRDTNLSKLPLPVFANHSQATLALKIRKGTKKFENRWYLIDTSLYSSRVILKKCKTCNNKVPSAYCRNEYCKDCSKKGLSRKIQGKVISLKYKGKNNPNYTNGNSRKSFRSNKEWKILKKQIGYKCIITGNTENIHFHHILPYALFPNLKFDVSNIIPITNHIHIELHRLLLDLQFLPILYYIHKQDAQQLVPEFCRLLQSHIPDLHICKKYFAHDLLKVVPKNYHKKIKDLHPEFSQQVLGL